MCKYLVEFAGFCFKRFSTTELAKTGLEIFSHKSGDWLVKTGLEVCQHSSGVLVG